MLIEHGHRQIWLVRAYLGSFFEPEGAFRPQICDMFHPDTDKEGKHGIDIPKEILG